MNILSIELVMFILNASELAWQKGVSSNYPVFKGGSLPGVNLFFLLFEKIWGIRISHNNRQVKK